MGTHVSPTPLPPQERRVDPEMLRNLELLSNLELMKQESNWEVLKNIPAHAFEDPQGFEEMTIEALPSEEKK